MNKLIFMLSCLMFTLVSCGKFSDGSSVWQGGLWVIVALPLIGAAIFFYQAYKASQSGSTTQVNRGGQVIKVHSDENVPIYKLGKFWFGVGLVVAAIVFVIMVNADK